MTNQEGISEEMRTLIIVLFLIFIYPVGLLLVWFWAGWKKWVKILITLPIIVLPLLAFIVIATVNPAEQFEKARQMCIDSCNYNYAGNDTELKVCYQRCDEINKSIDR